MKVIHLKTGWDKSDFETVLQHHIDTTEYGGKWEYYDIKISSKGNNTLLIFKKKK